MKKQQLFTLEDWSGSDVKIIDHSESFKEIIELAYNFFPSNGQVGDTLHVCLTERTAEGIDYEIEDKELKFKYGDSEIRRIDESILGIHGVSIITLKSQKEATLFMDLSESCEIYLKRKEDGE